MSDSPESVVRVEGLTLDLSGRRILRDLNLSIGQGEFLGLIGPNGGGKTSLLRVLLGLMAPTQGRVVWSAARPRLGYVPQKCGMERDFPLSGHEVVKLGAAGSMPLFGLKARAVEAKATELIRQVGLPEHEQTPFVHLSGGQQRRLLLARALMNDPDALLLDEPTAGVDSQGQEQFCDLLCDLSRRGVTIVLVSHDIPLITSHADRIACLCVGLHWHGAADALSEHIILEAYRCELERYQLFSHRKPGHVHPDGDHSCSLDESKRRAEDHR